MKYEYDRLYSATFINAVRTLVLHVIGQLREHERPVADLPEIVDAVDAQHPDIGRETRQLDSDAQQLSEWQPGFTALTAAITIRNLGSGFYADDGRGNGGALSRLHGLYHCVLDDTPEEYDELAGRILDHLWTGIGEGEQAWRVPREDE
jgi:hypothetical protein